MRYLLLASSTVAAICLASCASPKDNFTLAPAKGQQATISHGTPSLMSEKRHVMYLRPQAAEQASGVRPGFVVAIMNRSKKPVTLTVASITAASVRPKRTALRVFSQSELTDEIESRRNAAMVVSALAGVTGAISAANSGYSTTTGYSGRSGPFTATTYNPAAAQVAAQANIDRTAVTMATIDAQASDALARLQGEVIKDHTLMPGEWHGGLVVLDNPTRTEAGVAEYEISITFDGEQHTFNVVQTRRN